MNFRTFPMIAAACFAVAGASCQPQANAANPVAAGTVTWLRDYDQALADAKSSGKPVFLLFQEIPGCAGCQQFGRDVLANPEVVAMIEKNFTPLLVPNNQGGKDAEILQKYNEPAWNYQVVRFLDSEGRDLIPRKDHVWDAEPLKARMILALEKAGRGKPQADVTKRVAFAQYCFWTGEMKLGAVDGVVRTEAGYLNDGEVTVVDYDPARISLAELTRQAKAAGVATQVFTKLDGYQTAPAADQKRQLQGTPYSKMKLTPEQATKINAFVGVSPAKADQYLPKRP